MDKSKNVLTAEQARRIRRLSLENIDKIFVKIYYMIGKEAKKGNNSIIFNEEDLQVSSAFLQRIEGEICKKMAELGYDVHVSGFSTFEISWKEK